MSNLSRKLARKSGRSIEDLLHELNPSLPNGFKLSSFIKLSFGDYRAYVYNDYALPPPESGVRARVDIGCSETRSPHIREILRGRINDAIAACNDLIAERTAVAS